MADRNEDERFREFTREWLGSENRQFGYTSAPNGGVVSVKLTIQGPGEQPRSVEFRAPNGLLQVSFK